MKIQVLAIGTKMPAWVETGCETYLKRMPRTCPVTVKALPLAQRGKNTPAREAMQKEGRQLLGAVESNHRLIALDSGGKQWSTEQLAAAMEDWRMAGDPVSLMIGGPDGLDAPCLERADHIWSLSHLTLPHPLVRVLLVEQLYRAWSLLNNHPYHK